MLKASSSINTIAGSGVEVITSVVLSEGTADELRAANAGELPKFDLESVVYAVTDRTSGATDYREVITGASYRVLLPIRSESDAAADGFLATEATALAPLLVLALEALLYDIADSARVPYVGRRPLPPLDPLHRFSWGPSEPCVPGLPPFYDHYPTRTRYNNTNRIGWTTTFSADGSKLPEVLLPYNGDDDDEGLLVRDGFRVLPGSWPGNLVGVHGVDTRICHIYIIGARIEKGSITPGVPDICRLDMRYATTYRYNMVYAEAVYAGGSTSEENDSLANYPYRYAIDPLLVPSSQEEADALSAIAATLPTGGGPPSGPPFYRDDAAYGRPINLFDVPDDYLDTRLVYIPDSPNNLTTYSDLVFDPGSNNPSLGNRIKLYQKLVANGDAWNPEIDMRRLATALFYPPQQYVFEGLQVQSASGDDVPAFDNLVTTLLNPGGAPELSAWKLAQVGRVAADGTTSDSLFVPATWHEVNGYGLELLNVSSWKFKAPSSVSRTYPASIAEARSWYNVGDHDVLPGSAHLHTVTAVPERMPFPTSRITEGATWISPVISSFQQPGVFRVPRKVAHVHDVRPGVRPGDILTSAKIAPLLREGQPFDLRLKCTQHKWRTVHRAGIRSEENTQPPHDPPYNYFSAYASPSAPFWGPTIVEATITASGCSVNCGSS